MQITRTVAGLAFMLGNGTVRILPVTMSCIFNGYHPLKIVTIEAGEVFIASESGRFPGSIEICRLSGSTGQEQGG
jgi:hypothetical protein